MFIILLPCLFCSVFVSSFFAMFLLHVCSEACLSQVLFRRVFVWQCVNIFACVYWNACAHMCVSCMYVHAQRMCVHCVGSYICCICSCMRMNVRAVSMFAAFESMKATDEDVG